ncbi:class II aldolase/adducin family protein [Microbulbifer marinus]|uniref:Ribulose-5-phosphate 4-epimerase/Fuculose-1-phosphate aldolase n=1 Tax=Microbulbifer marinus TaxID=658218 RepID=A0A1H4B9S4_9GAMM|nr:class II aldolase/adducin family protein [Microbulbifer marinus]SEA44889.1 Ribulose-5-phosphate 4-epimerase/Fuculose-1-phosphate aldolase [Microbulbifer marinus]
MHTQLDTIPSLKGKVSDEEWQLRVDLAAAYRLIAHYGWDDLIFTHLSVRVPGPEHRFLINPFGAMFDEITASSLVKIDVHGEKVDDSPFPVNPAGFTIHSAIHEAREDAQCVMHTHTTEGVAVAAHSEGLLPISQQSLFPLSSLAYHDYEGIAVREDEKARLVSDLGTANYMILRNHGLLTCAPTVADALLAMFILQRSCEIQVAALAGNRPLTPVPQPIIDKIQSEGDKVTSSQGGLLAWPGLLRKLDRIDSSYRN